jgi:hypothetical protein
LGDLAEGNHSLRRPTTTNFLAILFDELAVLVSHIVELVSIGFYSIVTTISATGGFFLIFIVPIVVSTLGGIEIGIESRFTPIDLTTPILFVFGYHFVSATTPLGVIVIAWNAHYICWIDLEDHCLSTIAIRE